MVKMKNNYKIKFFFLNLYILILIKYNIIIHNDIFKIEKYLILCKSSKLLNEKYLKVMKNPKVSIISAVYNREKYLIRFINSIQKQKFNDVEIIFIDDFSEDNSIKIIENSQQKDKRILLIKNKKNKGTFICRNLGVLKSRGEYLLLPDPDDIISQDIIDMSYKLSKKKNYEMIRFAVYIEILLLMKFNICHPL
jgi:hypothetical protein